MDNLNIDPKMPLLTPDILGDSKKLSPSTSAGCGEESIFVETSQALSWPLSPIHSERIVHAKAGKKLVHKSWAGKPEKKLSFSTSGESDVKSSSLKAGGFSITESEPFTDPTTGDDSFGGQALCWYENPTKRAHGSAENHGVEPEFKVEIISSSTSAECGEGFTSPKLEICLACSRPLCHNHSERVVNAETGKQMNSHNKSWTGKPENEFYSQAAMEEERARHARQVHVLQQKITAYENEIEARDLRARQRREEVSTFLVIALFQAFLGVGIVSCEYSLQQMKMMHLTEEDEIMKLLIYIMIFAVAVFDLGCEYWMKKAVTALSLFAVYFTFAHMISAVAKVDAYCSYSGVVLATIISFKHCASVFRLTRNFEGHED